MFASKKGLKQVMGNLPLTAELDWFIRRRGQAVRGFSLEELDAVLADWQAQAAGSPYLGRDGKKVFIFAELRYWIGHAALLGLGLAGLGHEVTLGFLPYGDWRKPVADFDLRQHNLYGRKVLSQAKPMLDVISLLDMPAADDLPAKLSEAVEAVSVRDVQYTEQVEEIDRQGELFKMRWERNQRAAAVMLRWLQENQPDVIILPNGLILEFGAIYETAQHLDIPAVTYEFGEQRERIWFSQQSPVMLQDSDALWQGRQAQPFSEAQLAQVQELFAARQGATLWQNFSRQWQEAPSEGSAQVRAKLGLGGRPVVLLAANVIGDSLTLGRQIFSGSMTEWLKRTLAYFAARPEVQFVLRVHPGERGLDGPSVADLVNAALPDLPEHMRLVAAEDSINTYDLISIADLGLVYTTTVGMEMAMSGVPVVVVGKTHYGGKGFSLDPASWEDYFAILDRALNSPESVRPSQAQTKQAWHYAYRFFFDYPRPFPWHLLHFWENVDEWPLGRVLSEAGQEQYAETFKYLVGEPIDWKNMQ